MVLQYENGFTKIDNNLLEFLTKHRLSGQEYQIMLAIIRKTNGYHKETDQISYGQLSKLTGINRRKVISLIQSLVSKKALGSAQNGTRQPLTFWINKNFKEWLTSAQKNTSAQKDTKPSAQKDTKPSAQKGHPQKKGEKKKEKKKEGDEKKIFSSDLDKKEELFAEFQNPNIQNLIKDCLECIALTRKSGKMKDSVVIKILKHLKQFENWKIGTGITKYLENEYYLDGKGESYLLGIIRNINERDYNKVIGRLKNSRNISESSQYTQTNSDIKPNTWSQAESAERRAMAQWLIQQNKKGNS